jgi:signal transduction histidine kinase
MNKLNTISYTTFKVEKMIISTSEIFLGKYNDEIKSKTQKEDTPVASYLNMDSILNSVTDIIYRLSPDGRIMFISDSVKRYGYSLDELLGKYFMELVHPDDRNEAENRVKERRTGKRGGTPFEARLLTKSVNAPTFKVFSICAEGLYRFNRSTSNHFLGTQGVARDITDIKFLEDQILQEPIMRAVGALAGGIANNFNNLLMGIQGYVSIMLLDLYPDHPHHDKLKKIENCVERGSNLTKKLLDLSSCVRYVKKSSKLTI